MKKIAAVTIIIILFSCSPQRYIDEGIKGTQLKEGETHCQLNKITRTINGGHKYLFLSEKGDTLIRIYPGQIWFKVGEWYCVRN